MSKDRTGKKSVRQTWKDAIRRVKFYDEDFSTKNFIKAVDANDIAVVEEYLLRGQDPNDHVGDLVTPLHIIAMHGFNNLGQLLLNHQNINVNPTDHLGRTPLIRACRYCNIEIVELLLQHKANINVPDRTGNTALHHTASWGWQNIMAALLKYKPNANIVNAFGKAPLHIACVDNPNINMVAMLCKKGANIDLNSGLVMPVLLVCCLNCFDYDHLNMVDLLIYFDADVNVVYNLNGQTAMHMVAITGFVPLAEILCTAGANPNVMDNQFRTPYDVAIQMENIEMVQFLKRFFVSETAEIRKTERRKTFTPSMKNKRKRNYETF